MFRRPTVFVLGAGSSKEADLPTGADLRSTIAGLLSTRENDYGETWPADSEINEAIRRAAQESGASVALYVQAAESVATAMPLALSIDNYLEAHQHDSHKVLVGKLAITKAILDAEANSLLRPSHEWDDDIDFEKVKDSWFVRFMQAATEGATNRDLTNIFQDISVINFNYDRCLEYIVKRSLQIYFDLDEQEAIEIAKTLYIFHPYGSVGSLPWQQNGHGVPFGSQKRGSRLLEIARSIKTFSERVDEGTELNQMKVRVGNAERIICLGFAYHRQNLELLSPSAPTEDISVYGTAFHISKSDQAVIRSQLPEYLSPSQDSVSVNLASLTCAGMLEEYWRTFTS